MNVLFLTASAPVVAVITASLLQRMWAKRDAKVAKLAAEATAMAAATAAAAATTAAKTAQTTAAAAKEDHAQTIDKLQTISINVDGNLTKQIKLTESLKEEVAGLREVVANQAEAISNQAEAIANLTGAVEQNGKKNGHI